MVTRALTLLVTILAVGAGLLIWHSQYGAHAIEEKRINRLTAGSINELSAADIQLLVESQFKAQPQAIKELAESPEARKEFMEEQLKPLLAISRQARIEGIADEPEIKDQLKLTELEVLALAYDQKLKNEAGRPNDPGPQFGYAMQKISDEEVNAFYQNPKNEKDLGKFVEGLKKRNPTGGEIPEEQMKSLRDQWAKAHIAADRAREAGLDQDRATQLQLQFQQARILAQEYAKRHQKEFEATKEDIDKYIAEHPELNPAKVRKKAEQVLQRAKAGEDFAKLAAEFSEDPGSKDNGGLYENVKKGQFVPQFELAANNLQPGQIADKLVESQYGFHIIKLESRGTTKDKDGKEEETFNVRHILFMTQARDPNNPFAQPMSMEQKIKQDVQQAKIKKFVEEIVAKNPIKLPNPEEINIKAPEIPAGGGMEGLPPGVQMEAAPPAPAKSGAGVKPAAQKPERK